MIRIKVFTDKLKLDLADDLEASFHAEAKEAVNEAADMVLDEIRSRLKQRRGTKQTAAAPGESPEMDTGDLATSFRRIAATVKGRAVIAKIRSDDPGANRLEFGKTDERGIRTFPHPYVAPSFKAAQPRVDAMLQERLT